jgi:hypothetical protein
LFLASHEIRRDEMSSLTRDELAKIFEPVRALSHNEKVFDVGGLPVTIRTLMPHEEVEVQRTAALVMSEAGEDERTQATLLAYLNKVKVGTLSYAIIALGDHDFRDVEGVETGELLPNGVPVRIPTYKAVREFVGQWSQAMVAAMFKKVGDLVTEVELRVGEAIKFDSPELDFEIKRLETKLEELREKKRQQDDDLREGVFGKDLHTRQMREIIKRDSQSPEEKAEELARKREKEGATAATPAPEGEEVAAPLQAPPQPEMPPQGPPASAIPKSAPPPPTPPARERRVPPGLDKVAAERAQAAQAKRLEQLQPIPVDALREAKPIGDVGGVPAYSMEETVIRDPSGGRGREPVADNIDPPESQSRNPNFRPPSHR